MDDKVNCLYAKGMTTREITATFKEMYDADVSPTLISKITNAVIEQVVEWQSRPLDAVYPLVYLDCIVVKVRQDKQVIKKRKLFSTDDSAKKVVYLAITEASKKWTMPIRNW